MRSDNLATVTKSTGKEINAIKAAQKIVATTLVFKKTNIVGKSFNQAPSYFYSATWNFQPNDPNAVPIVHFEFASGTSASLANGGISTIKKINGNSVLLRVISISPGYANIIANSNTEGTLS